ncbi:MAG: hypothetical protein KKD48_00030 [Nanoarchaeota archaeon]|nr:hypothetical protein [Nanoarchaeota archaeon]
MFSKRHYIKIAKILKDTKPTEINNDLQTGKDIEYNQIVNCFVYHLKEDNPRFNVTKFMEACE